MAVLSDSVKGAIAATMFSTILGGTGTFFALSTKLEVQETRMEALKEDVKSIEDRLHASEVKLVQAESADKHTADVLEGLTITLKELSHNTAELSKAMARMEERYKK